MGNRIFDYRLIRTAAGAVSGLVRAPFLKGIKKQYRLLFLAILVYLIIGIGFAIPIYGFKIDNDITRFSERFYPYPAAIVNGGIVSLRALHKQEGFVFQFAERTGQGLETQSPRQQVLDQLIENKLIAKAAAQNGYHLPLDAVDGAFNKVLSENGGKDNVEKVLGNLYSMSLADFRALVRAQVLKDKVREDLLKRVRPSHILVGDQARAQEVLDKVKSGESFEDLAKQFSEDTASREQGGDLGFVGRGVLVQEFEAAAFGLQSGQLHPDLVKTEFGHHIIRLEEVNNGKIDKSYDQFLTDLKNSTRVIKLVE